jgi:2-keto-4-pentenoate hydratase/2-oxohepta-3-ene-1,7-dioic acid hydratase in catechol pathway
MRVLRRRDERGALRTGFLDGDDVFDVPGDEGVRELSLVLDEGSDQLSRMHEAALAGASRPLSDVTLTAPLVRPRAVFCVGRNYVEHATETQAEPPTEPILFAKLCSAIVGPSDDVLLPAAAPRRVDYEAELAVVIGRRGRDIAEADAWSFVLGYAVANDVTARDWQVKKPGGQWLLGKSFDTFLPIGPWVVTRDELPDASRARITCRVNGKLVQDDTADHMIFSIPTLIAYISKVASLSPGDLVLTGTPAGVGAARVPPRWLVSGDVLETSVDGIGTLRNTVKRADAQP